MAAKKFVKHHQPGRPVNTFVLIKEHKDKTCDFGFEDGAVVVERCPIGPQSDPSRSYAEITDEDDDDANADAVKVAKALRTKANKLTAEAGKGKPEAAALAQAAEEAAAAAKQADEDADAAEAGAKA